MSILVTILIIIASIFFLTFIAGMLFAAFGNRRKALRAQSIVQLAQLPQELIPKLTGIMQAQRANNATEANRIIETIDDKSLSDLFQLIRPENRPKNLSAGKNGDLVSRISMEQALNEQGYTIKSSKIITGIYQYHLDGVLLEIGDNKNK